MRRFQRVTSTIAVVAFSTVLIGVDSARASLIRHTFSGTITTAENEYQALLGQGFTGTLTYETSTAPVPSLGIEGTDYPHAPPYDLAVGLDIVIGGTQFLNDDTQEFTVTVINDSALPGAHDRLGALGQNTPIFSFRDISGTQFDDETLPTTLSLGPSAFASFFLLAAIGSTSQTVLQGQIDTLVTVPEPTPSLLVGLGIAGIAAGRRRKKP